MAKEKLTISWDDLRARRVDNRLREQDAMDRNRAYAQMKEDALPTAAPQKAGIWNNAIFCMSVFGLIGGLLAWGAEILVAGPLKPAIGTVLHYDPNARSASDARLASLRNIELKRQIGQFTDAEAQAAAEEVRQDGRGNPWFRLAANDQLSDTQRKAKVVELEAAERFALFIINLLSYGVCGMMIAMCLAVAEPLTQHKFWAAWSNAGAGGILGLIGGIAAALLTDRISRLAGSVTEGQSGWIQQLATQSAVWGALGLFLGLG